MSKQIENEYDEEMAEEQAFARAWDYEEMGEYESDDRYEVNPNGICEDAPCCGCCGRVPGGF